MNITSSELKLLIKDIIVESMNEIYDDDYDDDERGKSSDDDLTYMYHDDVDIDDVESLIDVVKTLSRRIDNQDRNAYDQLIDIKNKITNVIDDPRLSKIERDKLADEYDGVLGLIQGALDMEIGGVRNSSDDSDKMYIAETWEESIAGGSLMEKVVNEVAPPGMESWVKANKERFVNRYGKKKGSGILYATAWKMFYKRKKK